MYLQNNPQDLNATGHYSMTSPRQWSFNYWPASFPGWPYSQTDLIPRLASFPDWPHSQTGLIPRPASFPDWPHSPAGLISRLASFPGQELEGAWE